MTKITLNELNDRIEENRQKAEELLNDPTQENLQKARELVAVANKDRDDAQAIATLGKELAELQGFTRAPVTNGPIFHGYEASGFIDVDTKGNVVGTSERDTDVSGRTGMRYKADFFSFIRNKDYSKSLQVSDDGSGGFLVPEDFENMLIEKKPTLTDVYDLTTKIDCSSDAFVAPQSVYSSDDIYPNPIRFQWTGELPPSASSAQVSPPQFGVKRIPVFTGMMSLPLTNNMIEDPLFDIQSWIYEKFSEAIAIERDRVILAGSGVGQPTGILTVAGAGGSNAPASIAVGSSGQATSQGLIELAWKIPDQYQRNLAWVFAKTTSGASIAGLEDANGRPLWGTGLMDAGLIDAKGGRGGGYNAKRFLEGIPVTFSELMPPSGASGNAGNSAFICGDFSSYYFVNRVGMSIQVLRELYAQTNQILVLARMRVGGDLVEPWKLKVGTV